MLGILLRVPEKCQMLNNNFLRLRKAFMPDLREILLNCSWWMGCQVISEPEGASVVASGLEVRERVESREI